jgi:UDP-N-acetylglucosamine 2-epimerase (non-hydrolysing)
MTQFIHVIGARPNFMKVAPVFRALAKKTKIDQILVHTGQHYDFNMSDVFFQQLDIPQPHINLKVGAGSHAQQTAQVMTRFEEVVLQERPRCVVVYGDVNSTVAAALVCSKLHIPVAHVEAGLRSFDRSMPEELNRLVTDQLSDLLFTPSLDGNENLKREGICDSRVRFVGNVMIDTLVRMLPEANKVNMDGLPERFILVTLHRPSNVDDTEWLSGMIEVLREFSAKVPVVFPIHPRTRERLKAAGVSTNGNSSLHFLEPAPYIEFLALQTRAVAVVTDSGGIQEETTYIGVPCLTVRENTERPVTTTVGTNVLVGRDLGRIRKEIDTVLCGKRKESSIPELWDGLAADRIARELVDAYS